MRWAATSVRLTNAPIDQMCQPNCNDQIAARAFGATEHITPLEVGRLMTHDAVFITMSKIRESWEPRWMDVAHQLKDAGKTVLLFQEAETSWPLTRSWEEIQSFIELLKKVDLFLTHNQRDVELWGRLAKKAIRWRTCIDIFPALEYRFAPSEKLTKPILCGSSYDDRANGLTGLIAVKDMGHPIWHQNRSTGYADRNRDLPGLVGATIEKEIPHSGYWEWLNGITGAYIAIHPMPAAAAGRDQIAFAALGIPCIGNAELDIQQELFPALAVPDIYNTQLIRGLVRGLLSNPQFYSDCREIALDTVHMYGLPYAAEQANHIKEQMGWQ